MKIFYNILKRKSISKLIKNLPDGSYYLMPWENRGYQLGIEKDLNGKKLIQYSCGILAKTGTEYVNYRYLRHSKFAIDITMSKQVKEFLSQLNIERNYDEIVKSPRVFDKKITKKAMGNNNILIICPLDYNITYNLLKLFCNKKHYSVKFKFHPYDIPKVDEKIVEKRALSECLKDYSIAIYSGFTSAIFEVYFTGLKVFRLYNLNALSLDPMSNFDVKEIRTIDDVNNHESVKSEASNLQNYFIGLSEQEFTEYINKLIRK